MGSSSPKITLPLLVTVYIAILAASIAPLFLGSNNDQVIMRSDSVEINGMPFPSEIKVAGSKQSLIGGGARTKWGFRVYTVGIFGDMKLVKSLKKKSSSDNDVSRNFSESKLARTLLLRFHRSVSSSDVSEALGEALVGKVGEETSEKFKTFILDMVTKQGKEGFEKGSDMYITCKGEKLWASLTEEDDVGTSTISIKGLCSSIFLVYLGDKPVSTQAKEGFEKGFADFVIS